MSNNDQHNPGSDESRVVVERVIDAPANEVFDVLTNPNKHVELDGSGFVRSLAQGDRIAAVGDVFTINMEGEHMGGEYQTDNHVTAFDKNKMVGWQTAPAGEEPPGWEWLWQLEAEGPDSTKVTLTYDWSKVTDKELLKKISFPLVTESELDDSLNRLASAVVDN